MVGTALPQMGAVEEPVTKELVGLGVASDEQVVVDGILVVAAVVIFEGAVSERVMEELLSSFS